ncbi:trypsin-like peptidase domain-containing protein, partial [Rhodobacterales bacterium]
MSTAIVFVHGINAHLALPKQEKAWRDALSRGGIEMAGVPSAFAYYSDWFFAPKTEGGPALTEAVLVKSESGERRREAEADVARLVARSRETVSPEEIELMKSATAELSADPTREGLSNLDISSLFPAQLVEALIRDMVFQLYDYFDNVAVEHPETGQKSKARTLIRGRFRAAVDAARAAVGEGGTVIVLAHSMGSVVAWDCLQHDKKCAEVDGLITFGSPLGLDFVQRELAAVAGNDYRRTFPKKLNGDWHNLIARFDRVATLDTSFPDIFPGGAPHRINTTWLNNPDFRWTIRPSARLTSAHSGSGYLRSRAMAAAVREFGLRAKPTLNEAASVTVSAGVEALAAQRYNAHELSRRQKEARLAAQNSVLGIEADERVINQLNQHGIDHTTASRMVAEARANPAGRVMLERVLGTPDFIQRSYALRMAVITSSVGQVLIGKQIFGDPSGFGTGFLISPRLLMTNNHVLSSEAMAAGSTVRFDYSKDIDDIDLPGEEYALRPDIFFVTSHADQLDFTIVAVDEPAGGLGRPWSRLIRGSGKILLGQSVNIVQHPRGRRQELITRNSTLTFIDDKPDYAHYSGDTEPGSSGSPCYNDRWELAFLHHASVPKTDKHGNYVKKNGQLWREGDSDNDIDWLANEGIRISRIVAEVEKQGLTPERARLFEQCFEDPKLGKFLHIGLKASGSEDFTEETQNNGQIVRRHPDGRVSYLFEVSFGPYGGGSATASGGEETPRKNGHGATSPL